MSLVIPSAKLPLLSIDMITSRVLPEKIYGFFYFLYIADPYSIIHASTIDRISYKRRRRVARGGEIVMGWLRFLKFDFHGLGTCLVVRTLRGKSLMLHAFPFMDLSQLDGISFWQGPPTLYL